MKPTRTTPMSDDRLVRMLERFVFLRSACKDLTRQAPSELSSEVRRLNEACRLIEDLTCMAVWAHLLDCPMPRGVA